MNYYKINIIPFMKCEVCGSNKLREVFTLGNQPLCDDLIKIGDTKTSKRYPVNIWLCSNCKTAIQEFNVPKKTLFPDSYHYRAKVTPSVVSGMKNLVENIQKKFFKDLKDKVVLDVGCNDGSLLNIFKEKSAKTFGIEPTSAVHDAEVNHICFKDFFSPISAEKIKNQIGFPDVITFTNVFAHIENMDELIFSLSKLIGEETLLVIENHYLGSVLEKNQFDTFYHEHPRTYSMRSFDVIAELLGCKLVDIERTSRYGGNIRAYIKKSNYPSCNIDEEADFEKGFDKMNAFIPNWIESKTKLIRSETKNNGPMTAISFPGRASILINLLGLTEKDIEATYEIKGSVKTGFYIPGTRIPILPEEILFDKTLRPNSILNLAWHIEDDVRRNLADHNYFPNIINIL